MKQCLYLKYILCCLAAFLALNHAYSIPLKVPKKAVKYIKLILPKSVELEVSRRNISLQELDDLRNIKFNWLYKNKPVAMNWENYWTGSGEAKHFMQKLKRDGYPLYEPNVGLGLDGFPVGYIPQKRITSKLLKQIRAYEEKRIQGKFLHNIIGKNKAYFQEHREDIPYSLEELNHLFENNPNLDEMWIDHYKLFLKDEIKPEEHGGMVASLMLDNNPIGKSSVGKLSDIIVFGKQDLDSSILDFYYFGSNYEPDIINFSVDISDLVVGNPLLSSDIMFSPRFKKVMEGLSKQRLVVMSAGNQKIRFDHPHLYKRMKEFRDEADESYQLYENAIIVGGSSPSGKISDYSSYGEHLTILAPSELIATKNINGELVPSSGTSFAAPQVTAALTDTLALLPDLTPAQAKHLLQQTALYSSENAGVGILNHHYLLRVAHNISEKMKIGSKSLDDLVFSDEVYRIKLEESLFHLSLRTEFEFYYLHTVE